jgi:hypothetical protein
MTYADSTFLPALEFNNLLYEDNTQTSKNGISPNDSLHFLLSGQHIPGEKVTLIEEIAEEEEVDEADDEFDIPFDSLSVIYDRFNAGKQLPEDVEVFKYLKRYIYDSLTIHKTFPNKNRENRLEIKVINPCNDEVDIEDKNFRVMGMINSISVWLSNKNETDSLVYFNPNVLMSLIKLRKEDIVFKSISNKPAVFIPFSYCGNADDDIIISYIVFYNKKKYLYHINLEGENFCNYRLNDNLDNKLKDMPQKLKNEFIKQLKLYIQMINVYQEEV